MAGDRTIVPAKAKVSEYFHFNAVGHTVATSNASGQVQSSSLYEAYGNIVLTTGSSDNNRLANTKERDFSIGLDNHGFRYFDPEVGRYVSPDPIGYGDGPNWWIYVHCNPINHIDPLGLGNGDDAATMKEKAPKPKPRERREKPGFFQRIWNQLLTGKDRPKQHEIEAAEQGAMTHPIVKSMILDTVGGTIEGNNPELSDAEFIKVLDNSAKYLVDNSPCRGGYTFVGSEAKVKGRPVEVLFLAGYDIEEGSFAGGLVAPRLGGAKVKGVGIDLHFGAETINTEFGGRHSAPIGLIDFTGPKGRGVGGFWMPGNDEIGIYMFQNIEKGGTEGTVGGGFYFKPSKMKNYVNPAYWAGTLEPEKEKKRYTAPVEDASKWSTSRKTHVPATLGLDMRRY